MYTSPTQCVTPPTTHHLHPQLVTHTTHHSHNLHSHNLSRTISIKHSHTQCDTPTQVVRKQCSTQQCTAVSKQCTVVLKALCVSGGSLCGVVEGIEGVVWWQAACRIELHLAATRLAWVPLTAHGSERLPFTPTRHLPFTTTRHERLPLATTRCSRPV